MSRDVLAKRVGAAGAEELSHSHTAAGAYSCGHNRRRP